jgi:hypothetical protein
MSPVQHGEMRVMRRAVDVVLPQVSKDTTASVRFTDTSQCVFVSEILNLPSCSCQIQVYKIVY